MEVAAIVVAISLSLAGVLEAWLSFAAWMKTVRVVVAVLPALSAATSRKAVSLPAAAARSSAAASSALAAPRR